jgi:DNA-binding transcriptional ArsR family regulator
MSEANLKEVDIQALIEAIQHPIRRAILRMFLDGASTLSPIRASRHLRMPLSTVNHHFKRLRGLGVVEVIKKKAVRGTLENHYRPKAGALDHPIMRSALSENHLRGG